MALGDAVARPIVDRIGRGGDDGVGLEPPPGAKMQEQLGRKAQHRKETHNAVAVVTGRAEPTVSHAVYGLSLIHI